jgi:hypothetical protein
VLDRLRVARTDDDLRQPSTTSSARCTTIRRPRSYWGQASRAVSRRHPAGGTTSTSSARSIDGGWSTAGPAPGRHERFAPACRLVATAAVAPLLPTAVSLQLLVGDQRLDDGEAETAAEHAAGEQKYLSHNIDLLTAVASICSTPG